jgi:DegV family protein with EDD domain
MRLVMDDAGDLPAEYVEKHNVKIMPVNVMFGTDEYLSGVNLDHRAFYEMVKTVGAHNFPKTAQPTPFQFVEAYKEIISQGEREILTITVGEKLSGTYASAVAAAKELDGQATFHLFDSMGGSAAQGFMVMEAAEMIAAGAGIEAIMTRLHEIRDTMVVTFLIDSLEYAVKGGRVSGLRGTMANLLNIKPIMKLEDGAIVEAGKVRTYKKALDYIVDFVYERVGDRPIKLAVIHARTPEGANQLQQLAAERFNVQQEILVDMCIPVAINLGPGALGLAVVPL